MEGQAQHQNSTTFNNYVIGLQGRQAHVGALIGGMGEMMS